MVKIAAPSASPENASPQLPPPKHIDLDDNLDGNGVYKFGLIKVNVFEEPDGKCYCHFNVIRGCDHKWRGDLSTAQSYGQYRQMVKPVTAKHATFDDPASLIAHLKSEAFRLWDKLRVREPNDKYIGYALNAIQDFDPERAAEAVMDEMNPPQSIAESFEYQEPQREAATPYRESDICPDPDLDRKVSIPPRTREEIEANGGSRLPIESLLANDMVEKFAEIVGADVVEVDEPVDEQSNDETAAEPEVVEEVEPVNEPEPLPMLPAEPPVESGELDQDLVDEWKKRLHNAKELVCELCVSEEAMKETLLSLKKQREEAVSELAQLTRNSPETCPAMFRVVTQAVTSVDANATTSEKNDEVATGQNQTTLGAGGDGDESWRTVALASLHLSPGILEILAESDITTIGHITDHTASGKRLTDIAKIGEAKAEKIEQALELFWQSRNGR